jgi:transcriptional regulator with XRE-family HTH domain
MKTNFPNVLKRLRTEQKLTQQQVADVINKSQRAYAHYEKGDQEPDISTLIKLAEHFNVSLDILMGRYVNVFENKALQL